MKNEKNAVSVNESQLRNMIAESLQKVLKEYASPEDDGALPYAYMANKGDVPLKTHMRTFGDKHKQSYIDKNNTIQKRLRQNGWTGGTHGAPINMILLDAIDKAMKEINDALDKYETHNPNDSEFETNIMRNLSKTLSKAFNDIRNNDKRIGGRRSDYRGR